MAEQKREVASKLKAEGQFWRIWDVLERVPVSKSTWWSWVASGKAPKSVKLGDRVTCWRAAEVIAFLDGGI